MRKYFFCGFFLKTDGGCYGSVLVTFPPLFVARRLHRTAPGRVRLPKDGQSGTSSASSSPGLYMPQRRDGGSSAVFENTTGMPVGGVEEGRRGFLGFGRRTGRKMPLNPLSALRPRCEMPNEDRSTTRLLQAVAKLCGKNRMRDEQLILQLTEEQRHDIVNRYAQTRWYGVFWYPVSNVTALQFKWWRRFAHFALFAVILVGLSVVLVLYYREVETVLLLDPEDRHDYQKMVFGMRFSEIYHLAMEVLKKEDPLGALPAPARYHLIIDAARERGWHKIDWELEARTRYSHSAVEDMDVIHLLYWGIMYIGSALTGSGELFSDRFGSLIELSEKQRDKDMENGFVHYGPESAPSPPQLPSEKTFPEKKNAFL